jgi:hypothetical protein
MQYAENIGFWNINFLPGVTENNGIPLLITGNDFRYRGSVCHASSSNPAPPISINESPTPKTELSGGDL